MKKSKTIYFFVLLFIFSNMIYNLSANAVPEKKCSISIRPFGFLFDLVGGDGYQELWNSSYDNDYEYETYYSLSPNATTPAITIDSLEAQIGSANFGIIEIESHGNIGTLAVEVYGNNIDGEMAADMAHTKYIVNKIYDETEICEPKQVDLGFWEIGVTEKFIKNHFKPAKNCMVWISACYSDTLADAFISKGAENYFGAKGLSTERKFKIEGDHLWKRLGGREALGDDKERNYTVGEVIKDFVTMAQKGAKDEVMYNLPKILEMELKQGEKTLYTYKYKYSSAYPFYNTADPNEDNYPGDLSKCVKVKAKSGGIVLKIKFSRSMNPAKFYAAYDPQGNGRGAQPIEFKNGKWSDWTDGAEYLYNNSSWTGEATIPDGQWKQYAGVADIIVKAWDSFEKDASSNNADGELDVNGDGQWDGADKNHRFIIGQIIRGAELLEKDGVSINETIFPLQNLTLTNNSWKRQWSGKTFNAGKWQEGKGVDTVILETVSEYPIEKLTANSSIAFKYNKTIGGYSQYWTGGPAPDTFWDLGIRVFGVAITAYNKNGTRIGSYSEVPELLKNAPGITDLTDIDGYPILIYRYRVGEYKSVRNWIQLDGTGYYAVAVSAGKNAKFNPLKGILQKEEPIKILNFIAGKIGANLKEVKTVKIHLLGYSNGTFWNAGGNGIGIGLPGGSYNQDSLAKDTVKPMDLSYNIITKDLDLSPPTGKTQKIVIKKKKTVKKSEQLANRAPALETSENIEASTDETIEEETDSDLGTYYAGDTIIVEGDITSDSEGGNIKGVWCMNDADSTENAALVWQSASASDGAYDSPTESFKYEYKLPQNIPEGTYTIELKSVNATGEEDAAYETLFFTAGGELNDRSTYISAASSDSLRILPASGEIKLEIPANTFSEDVTLTLSTITPSVTDAATIKVSSIGFEITNDKGLQPQKEIAVSIKYRDGDITALEEQKLMLGWYDEAHSRWVALPAKVDAENNKITSSIKHLSKFGMIQLAAATDLSNVIIYPNPYKPGKHPQGLIIDNLTLTAEIKIYTITGELVKNVAYTTQNGRASWNGTNEYGNDVASGIYIAYIKSDTGTKKIKFAIQR